MASRVVRRLRTVKGRASFEAAGDGERLGKTEIVAFPPEPEIRSGRSVRRVAITVP